MSLQGYLYYSGIVVVSTVLLTSLLKALIKRDSIGKIIILALTISLITIMSYGADRHQNRIWYWIACVNVLVATLWLYPIKEVVANHINRYIFDSAKQKLMPQKIVICCITFMVFAISVIIYILTTDLSQLFSEDNLVTCICIIFSSLLGLYLVQKILCHHMKEQAIKRKLFHIGPLLVVPIIHYLNNNVLLLILSAGFYLFFVLELIRYNFKYITCNINSQRKNINTINILFHLEGIFLWMSKFNNRQTSFWFTHLFLISSLLLSYSFKPLTQDYFGVSEHVALCMIAADGMAAIIGKKIGKHKIYRQKTMEGSLAFLLTFIATYLMIQQQSGVIYMFFVGIGCCIGELVGGDADNMVTLLVFYSLTVIFHPF